MDAAPLPDRCEVLVVGGGLAGLEVAIELDRLGIEDVSVIEAGPATDLLHVNVTHAEEQAHRLWLEPATDRHFYRPWTSSCPPHYEGASGLRRRLGGRSLYWYGIVLPIEDQALIQPWWPADVVADLTESWLGGPSLYSRAVERLEAWRGNPLDDGVPPVELGSLDLFRTPRAVCGATTPGRWFAYSPLDAWRDPVTASSRHKPGAHLHPRTEAVTLLTGKGGVEGALVRNYSGEIRRINAGAVVLAAGAIESARLAVQALVGQGLLEEARVAGLVDHIVQGAFVRLSPSQTHGLLDRFGDGSWYAPCPEVGSNLFFDLTTRPDGGAFVELQMTGEQMPSEASGVDWDASGSPPWPATVRTITTDRDAAVIKGQQQRLRGAWEALKLEVSGLAGDLRFADYNAPVNTNALLLDSSLDALPCGRPETWCNQLGTEDHEAGSLPLGKLVTTRHELLGLAGVFVAGPATFPRLGAANPALTTVALASRLAGAIAERA